LVLATRASRLSEVTGSVQLQVLDTAEIGIGRGQMPDACTARRRHHQRVVHEEAVLTPNVCSTKERANIERDDVDPHQWNAFDLIVVDV